MKYLRIVKIALCLILAAALGLGKGMKISMTFPEPIMKVCDFISLISLFLICIINCIENYKSKQKLKFGGWLVLGLAALILGIKFAIN